MTLDISNLTKADVYAAAQDLAQRLERQIAISEVLRAENHQMAASPCLACETIWPERQEALLDLLKESLVLLDAAARQRREAVSTDPVARMIAAEQWPYYLKEVDKYRRKVSVVEQKWA